MDKDIYDILNDAEFSYDELMSDKIEKTGFNDIEKKKIKRRLNKSMSRKRHTKKKIVAIVAATISIVALLNSNVRSVVWASVTELVNKFDPSKNSSTDFVVELSDEVNQNGVNIKLNEVYRNESEIRLLYSMTFEKGVPDSVKAVKIPSNDDSVWIQENENDTISKKEFASYYNGGIVGCNIFVNGVNVLDSGNDIFYSTSRDLSIDENRIEKEVIIKFNKITLENDVNIEVKYDNVMGNDGSIIEGPWKISHTVKADDSQNLIQKTSFEGKYKYTLSTGEIIDIESYANTNTGLKIFSKNSNRSENTNIVRFEGTDNLGNKILMYCRYPTWRDEGDIEGIFQLYDGPAGLYDNRPTLAEGVTSVTLTLYENNMDTFVDGNYKENWVPLGEKFTINLE